MPNEMCKVLPVAPSVGKTVRRWQARNITELQCPVCGRIFPVSSAAQKYCSPACRKTAQQQKVFCLAKEGVKKPKQTLEQAVADADRWGISYGRYSLLRQKKGA